MTDPVLDVGGLWKVFAGARESGSARAPGPARRRAVSALMSSPLLDLPAAQLLRRTGCAVAVRGLSFSVARNEIFVVMGLSGSGKSTLVRCLTRLIEPTAGTVRLDGEDILAAGGARLRELRRHRFGMVFQNFGLLPHRRVIDNVAYGLEVRGVGRPARHRRAREVLDLVRLEGHENLYPDQLSGGMQQRVGLGRALAVDPDVLFLDEPFSALDPLIRRDMQNEVLRLHREVGKTMVFVTHDLNEALRLGRRVLIMRDGAMVQLGRPDEVVGAPADDYVRDFVRDVPRTHVLTLSWVMRPARPDDDVDGPVLAAQTLVRDAVPALRSSSAPVRVAQDGRIVGLVDSDTVLALVAGEKSRSVARPRAGALR